MRCRAIALMCASLWFGSPLGADTVGYYRFEEAAGETVLDASGNGNQGMVLNDALRSSDVPVGFIPQTWKRNTSSIELDGMDDVIVIPDAVSLRPETGLTLEAWVKPTGSAWVLIGKQFGPGCCGNSYQVEINPFRFQLTNPSGDSFLLTAPVSPSPDVWHHVAATWDGATMLLYLDGEEVASENYVGSIGYDSNPVLIGADDDGGGIPGCCLYQGTIDEVRISNVALMPGQFLPDFHCPLLSVLGDLGTEKVEARDRIVTTLYRFRDTVMTRSVSGKMMTRFYYRYGLEGTRILSRSPELRARSLDVLERVEPVLANAVEGHLAVLSRTDASLIDGLLRSARRDADPGLGLLISYLRVQLKSDQFLAQFGITRER